MYARKSHKNHTSSNNPLKKLYKYSKRHLHQKYNCTIQQTYNRLTGDMMAMNNTHEAAVFRDLLMSIDQTEFFKRIYYLKESVLRLSFIYDFYSENVKIFPNYTNLEVGKYLYKGINRKQRILNQNYLIKIKSKKGKSMTIFNSSVLEDINYDKTLEITKPFEEESLEISEYDDKWKIYNQNFDDSLYMIEMLIYKMKHAIEGIEDPQEKEVIQTLKNKQKLRKERLSLLVRKGTLFDSNSKEDKSTAKNSKVKFNFLNGNTKNTFEVNQSEGLDEKGIIEYKLAKNNNFKNFGINSARISKNLINYVGDHIPYEVLPTLPNSNKFAKTENFVREAESKQLEKENKMMKKYTKLSEDIRARFAYNCKFKILSTGRDTLAPVGTFTMSGSEQYKTSLRKSLNAINQRNLTKISKVNNSKKTKMVLHTSAKSVQTINSYMNTVDTLKSTNTLSTFQHTRNYQPVNLVKELQKSKKEKSKNKKGNYPSTRNSKDRHKNNINKLSPDVFSNKSKDTESSDKTNKLNYKTDKINFSELKVKSNRSLGFGKMMSE